MSDHDLDREMKKAIIAEKQAHAELLRAQARRLNAEAAEIEDLKKREGLS